MAIYFGILVLGGGGDTKVRGCIAFNFDFIIHIYYKTYKRIKL